MANENRNAEGQAQDIHHLIAIRREKLQELRANGQNPYVITSFDQTAHAREIKERFEDFEGKTVHYVVTHEGSGLGGVPKTMKTSCKGAELGKSLAVHGGSAPSSIAQVENWAKDAVK